VATLRGGPAGLRDAGTPPNLGGVANAPTAYTPDDSGGTRGTWPAVRGRRGDAWDGRNPHCDGSETVMGKRTGRRALVSEGNRDGGCSPFFRGPRRDRDDARPEGVSPPLYPSGSGPFPPITGGKDPSSDGKDIGNSNWAHLGWFASLSARTADKTWASRGLASRAPSQARYKRPRKKTEEHGTHSSGGLTPRFRSVSPLRARGQTGAPRTGERFLKNTSDKSVEVHRSAQRGMGLGLLPMKSAGAVHPQQPAPKCRGTKEANRPQVRKRRAANSGVATREGNGKSNGSPFLR